jgi:SAM-dependent methyltransferase
MRVTDFIPEPLKRPLRGLSERVRHFGFVHYCPVCRTWLRAFRSFGANERPAQCPICKSLERHRLAWLFLRGHTNLWDGAPKRFLHVAPEVALSTRFTRIPGVDYLTGDLAPGKAMIRLDITQIDFPDSSFDVIYCSHVLEHIPDDRKAMREFRRVLRPGGWAIIMVPMPRAETFEDAAVTDPAERARVFGQSDHVRIYGRDFPGRLREAGFEVEVVSAVDTTGPTAFARMGLLPHDLIFHCR